MDYLTNKSTEEKKINHHDAAYEPAYSFGALMSSFESFAFFMAPLSDHCAIGRAITKRPRIILHTTSFAKISFRLTYNYWMCLLEIFAFVRKLL